MYEETQTLNICYLKWAVEDPEAMKLVIEQGVIDPADKWALVLQAAGWSVVSRGGQTGLLQSPVQISQRVCLHPAVSSMAWQEGQAIINRDVTLNWTEGWDFFYSKIQVNSLSTKNCSKLSPF